MALTKYRAFEHLVGCDARAYPNCGTRRFAAPGGLALTALVVFVVAMSPSCGEAYAAARSGVVVAVSDGDTLTVLTAGNVQVKVRLAEIDAPEKKQAFGQASKKSLSDLCFDRPAEIKPLTTDRYGRTVARVYCSGVDANAEQVRRGMAWVYDRYVTDRSLYRLQDAARSGRIGLWQDEAPMAPWEWRARQRAGK